MRISVVVVIFIVSYHCRRNSLFTFFLYCIESLASIFSCVIISHELLTNLLELQMNEKTVNVLQGLCRDRMRLKIQDILKHFQVFCFSFGECFLLKADIQK